VRAGAIKPEGPAERRGGAKRSALHGAEHSSKLSHVIAGEARRWYSELRALCDHLIIRDVVDYWTYLRLGEAAVAFGDEASAVSANRRAIALKLPVEDLRSASEQLEFLVKSDFAIETAGRILPVLYESLSSQVRT
jgi:Ni,Fe-hydrogenase III component G